MKKFLPIRNITHAAVAIEHIVSYELINGDKNVLIKTILGQTYQFDGTPAEFREQLNSPNDTIMYKRYYEAKQLLEDWKEWCEKEMGGNDFQMLRETEAFLKKTTGNINYFS